MNRRGFLSFLGAAAAGATLDPERLLWKPKLISIPSVRSYEDFEAQYLRPAAENWANGIDRQILEHFNVGDILTIEVQYKLNPRTYLPLVPRRLMEFRITDVAASGMTFVNA